MKNFHLFNKLSKCQVERLLWLNLLTIPLSLVFIAHFFFQNYLYMRPCEQCVYIRFDMLVIALGAFVGLSFPKNIFLKILAYTLAFYGIWLGFEHSLMLNRIHDAVYTQNPFAKVQGCREIPIFPFNLPLHEWFASWFKPTGICGIDTPMPPQNTTFSPLQRFFIGTPPHFEDGLYSKGWYLIPNLQFLNMALACFIAFLCCFILLFAMFLAFALDKNRTGSKFYALIIIALLLIFKFTGEFAI